MNAKAKAQKILKELGFDFTTFTLDMFLHTVGERRGREIITIPWDMPPTFFGAWISDAEEAREYIFYRKQVSQIHQVHIQLHEVSHFLLRHPTLQINRKMISEAINGTASMPFGGVTQLRSPKFAEVEAEAETLTHLIQKTVILHTGLDQLIHHRSSEEDFANVIKTLGLA
jgi:hypothetical protein